VIPGPRAAGGLFVAPQRKTVTSTFQGRRAGYRTTPVRPAAATDFSSLLTDLTPDLSGLVSDLASMF
jgi:hypothetical protein